MMLGNLQNFFLAISRGKAREITVKSLQDGDKAFVFSERK